MRSHSRRFQTTRLPSPPSDSKNFRQNSNSSLNYGETNFTNNIPKGEKKHSFFRKRLQNAFWLWYILAGLVYAFYVLAITCFRLIGKCLQQAIICQKQRHRHAQNENRDAKQTEERTFSHHNNHISDEEEDEGPLIRHPLKSSLSSEVLFSSDEDNLGYDDLVTRGSQFSDFEDDCLSAFAEADENSFVDDYELPFVRLIDSVVYFINLYCNNYPAFRQEFSYAFRNWGCHPTPLEYKHNFNPKKIIRKGINFLKRRKFRAKMTRVYGDAHKRWVLRIALVSRLLIFVMQFILVNLPHYFKHKNDGFQFTPEDTYGKLLDGLVKRMFGGYINWDAHYFLHISVYGYTAENFLAFFPLLPMLLYIPSRIIYILLSSVISLSSIVVVVGALFNIWLFLKCTDNIYELTKFRTGASNQLITTACMIFSFNPASIFFNGLYTETLFAYLTSSVILCTLRGQTWTSLVYAAFSCLCRSNGILNVGFILAMELQNKLCSAKRFELFGFAMQSVGKLALSLLPFLLFQIYAVFVFCDNGKVYDNPAEIPLYCVQNNRVGIQSLPYSYIQKKYWNVGFLEYYQFKQIPNFILATPVLYILGTESWTTLKLSVSSMVHEKNLQHIYQLFHGVHGVFLTFFCLLFIHVQVSTRMIMAACPYLYVYLAVSHEYEVESFRNRQINMPVRSLGITLWSILYYIIGTIGFSLGLPWT